MIRRPPRSTLDRSSAASDVYKRQFYYRSGGMALYNAVTLERSRKGWYVTTIPGGRVSGKLIHYYVEARDGREKVVTTNGKATSPNVITVKTGGLTRAGGKK